MVSDKDETGCVHWRELALWHLPSFREVIESANKHVELWESFKVLLGEAETSESRKADVESIYSYAWWCVAESGDKWLAAEVETYFYEDLPVYDVFEAQVAKHIEPWQFERLEREFRYRLSDDEFAKFRSRYYEERERMKKERP
jgi:hypothetical protein